ncbi:MAG TPA: DUF2298 domain-containing protein, partial [Roseiflexaceae bacterium]|nr:DUF2298 domain-containing protein [Roseiflexaceae bacterium]
MVSQLFVWWLVAQVFGLAGLPLAGWLFRALPDRGYAFAKSLGLLLAGYLAWLAAMLGLAPFGAGLLIVSALAVAGVGLLVNRGPRTKNQEPRTEGGRDTATRFSFLGSQFFMTWLRQNWKVVLGYEVLFALALVFVALLRSRDFDGFVGPNPWNTERPMDFALFNAIRRSPNFPPHDPWLAGYSINYYYFGYMLMAGIALLSGLDPAVSYNLSLALIFALAAIGIAGLVFNLIGLTTGDRKQKTGDRRQETPADNLAPRVSRLVSLNSRVAAGRLLAIVLAVVLVLFAANQGGALQLITGTPMAVALESGDLWRAVVNGLGPREPLQLARPFQGDYFDGTTEIAPSSIQEAASGFNYWNSTRAL